MNCKSDFEGFIEMGLAGVLAIQDQSKSVRVGSGAS